MTFFTRICCIHMHQNYPIGTSLFHRMLRKQGLSNPATHDTIAVFLPHSLNPLLPSSSKSDARSSPDGFELEAAIKLLAEVQRGCRSSVGRDRTHVICIHEQIVICGEAVRSACKAKSKGLWRNVISPHAVSVVVSLGGEFRCRPDVLEWDCDLSDWIGSHSRD